MSLHLNVNFRPKAPWFGGDLQTMSAVLSPPKVSLDGATIEELRIDTDDGTGDVLLGQRLEQAPITRDDGGFAAWSVGGL